MANSVQIVKNSVRPPRRAPAKPVVPETAVERAVLTVLELAARTGLHPLTIRRAIAAGELKAANGGGRSPYRSSKSDAQAWWRARGGGVIFDGPEPEHDKTFVHPVGDVRLPLSPDEIARRKESLRQLIELFDELNGEARRDFPGETFEQDFIDVVAETYREREDAQ